MKNLNENKGITLIALVITIIVLLILAAVSISAVVGDNGVLNKATTARDETVAAQELEAINIGYGGLRIEKSDEEITTTDFKAELDNYFGDSTVVTSVEEVVTGSGSGSGSENSGSRRFKVTYATGNSYEIDLANGTAITSSQVIENYFETAVKPSTQVNSPDIGIAEDGTVVNLDLWSYVIENGAINLKGTQTTGSGYMYDASYGYLGGYIAMNSGEATGYVPGSATGSGFSDAPLISEYINSNTVYKIYGKVPMYIKIDGVTYTVKYMDYTFAGITNLNIAPEIPSSVERMKGTFAGCTNLTTASTIPSGVTNMEATFRDCSNLYKAPTIPSKVTNMNETFYGCNDLAGTLVINANPTTYTNCLYNSAISGTTLTLNGSSTKLSDIRNTAIMVGSGGETDNLNVTLGSGN